MIGWVLAFLIVETYLLVGAVLGVIGCLLDIQETGRRPDWKMIGYIVLLIFLWPVTLLR